VREKREARSGKQEAGSGEQGAGSGKQEAGSRQKPDSSVLTPVEGSLRCPIITKAPLFRFSLRAMMVWMESLFG